MAKKKSAKKKKTSAKAVDDKSITILLPQRLIDEKKYLEQNYPGTVESIVSLIFGDDSKFGITAINWGLQDEDDVPDETQFGPYKC